MPAVSSRSFTPNGMPCSGPRYLPAAISASAFLACASASSFVSVMMQRSFGSNCSIRLQIDVRQALGGELLLLDPARQLRHRRKRDVGVARRQRTGSLLLRTNVSRAGPELSPASTGFQRVAGAMCGSSATFRGPDAPFEKRRHRLPPARRRHLAFGGAHRHLRELFRFGEGGRRHRRARRRRRAERRRRARRRRRRGHAGALLLTAARDGRAEHAERGGDQELSARVHGHALCKSY